MSRCDSNIWSKLLGKNDSPGQCLTVLRERKSSILGNFDDYHKSLRKQSNGFVHCFPHLQVTTGLFFNCKSVSLVIFGGLLLLLFRIHSSVQFSRSIVSDFLWPHDLQHSRPPCPSPTPGAYPNSFPLSQWCHPTLLCSVIPFSSCPQSFQASGSFKMSQLFASGGQSTGVSASTSVLPMNTQDWSPLGWTGWISLQSKGFSRVFSNTTVQKHQFFSAQLSL